MDIQKIKKVREEKDFTEINKLIDQGWYLLHIANIDNETVCVFGYLDVSYLSENLKKYENGEITLNELRHQYGLKQIDENEANKLVKKVR
ncbi:hypothetical protein M3E13_15445 [Oceanobacillus kimchii]|uniref:hypothetical protein n=1 Tax=Oceanobacillus kimchii TaxID=746691 RepID=UPI0021A2FB7F|nr:hypothetical protein [Oceanobacillus kimchii]MCT1575659.1 hypothetical protein [Oceanobacillus kimchii]MCT2137290.1 hypothetical protein [Oceanobacillus kimchii]